MRRALAFVFTLALTASAQVYSPKVLAKGQPDSSNLSLLARGIYAQSGAQTPREKAEAIWRFFLTDGRFVAPGLWYHIAGWAYEEPAGEVLDPVKLLNSYGFGLCYQIAPLLEATWKAGGFEDARVWFLTGHTVAEVFYDGAYHYFDSDMMGYNTLADGSIASVRRLEDDGSIVVSKLKGPREVNPATASDPWYPADVREGAIGGLAALFTTKDDNWLMPFERAPQGHTMDFVLRPGERLIRYFQPEREDSFYLPYKQAHGEWLEFPQEIAQYGIRTEDGPRSQKDSRRWATGRLEYRPPLAAAATQIHEVRSPYVIIDAEFRLDTLLRSARDSIMLETSADDGRTWDPAGRIAGPHLGVWSTRAAVLTRSEHGRRSTVSGRYSYLVRTTKTGAAEVRDLRLATAVQLNPRTLPALHAGRNELVYSAGPRRTRHEVEFDPAAACSSAERCGNARYVSDGSQGYWIAESPGEAADLIFRIRAPEGAVLNAIHAGARFLDLSSGLAPDKFTAEVRKVYPVGARNAEASIAWSTSASGPFRTIWQYDSEPRWRDNIPETRVLRWPEVDREIAVPGRVSEVLVRYRVRNLAIDQFRLASESDAQAVSPLEIVHEWKEDGAARTRRVRVPAGTRELTYSIEIPSGAAVSNQSIVFECGNLN